MLILYVFIAVLSVMSHVASRPQEHVNSDCCSYINETFVIAMGERCTCPKHIFEDKPLVRIWICATTYVPYLTHNYTHVEAYCPSHNNTVDIQEGYESGHVDDAENLETTNKSVPSLSTLTAPIVHIQVVPDDDADYDMHNNTALNFTYNETCCRTGGNEHMTSEVSLTSALVSVLVFSVVFIVGLLRHKRRVTHRYNVARANEAEDAMKATRLPLPSFPHHSPQEETLYIHMTSPGNSVSENEPLPRPPRPFCPHDSPHEEPLYIHIPRKEHLV